MKKLVLIPIIALLLSGAGLVATVATYPVSVNGERLDVTVLNQNGTTYLPLKAVGQALGADVSWTGGSVEIETVDIEALKEACVMIFADDGKTQVQGSGVYTDYDEVTSALHLMDDNRTNIKTSSGNNLTVDETSQSLDIMTLSPDIEIKPCKIGDSAEVRVGDKVILVSSPNGAEDTIMYGTVIKLTNEIVVKGTSSKGSSGGGLFNMNGELIGILEAGDVGLKECYIKPMNDIRKAL
jgi:S1-C subfamily serine protease